MDPIAKMKEAAREGWSTFAPFETMTGSVAPILVKFAGINEGDCVLDVACGTADVALSAVRTIDGLTAVGLDPSAVVVSYLERFDGSLPQGNGAGRRG